MAKIEVSYYSGCAKVTGKSREMMEWEGQTLGQLIQRVRKTYGKKFDEALWDEENGKLKPGISVLVNGRNLPFDTKLESSDQIAFLMLMAGG